MVFCAILYLVFPLQVYAGSYELIPESDMHNGDGDIFQDTDPPPTPESTLTETAGRGEGLIFIASIIVLIILTGVIFSSRRRV